MTLILINKWKKLEVKLQKSNHPSLTFNGTSVTQSEIYKYIHIQNALNKVSKTIGLLRKLQKVLPEPPLITLYKSFIKPHLDLRASV